MRYSRRSPRLWISNWFLCFESIKVTAELTQWSLTEVNSMINYWQWLSIFSPFVLFCTAIAPLFFLPLAPQNRPQGFDSAHFENHWSKLFTNTFVVLSLVCSHRAGSRSQPFAWSVFYTSAVRKAFLFGNSLVSIFSSPFYKEVESEQNLQWKKQEY